MSPRSAAFVAGLLVAACAPEPEPDRDPDIPPITWSGTHLDYAPQPHAAPICRGTLPYMDRYLELAATTMDVELDGPVLYVHGSPDDEPFCKRSSIGCTSIEARVYSYMAPHEHELVHAVRSFGGFSQYFFEEGAAEMFGDDARLSGRGLPAGDLLEGIEIASPEGGYWYPRMGHFSAYLHDRHGPEITTAILRETGPFSSTAQTLAVLESATGMPFDDLRADYESEPECDQAHYRYPLYPCDAPEALRPRCEHDAVVPIEERIACDDFTTLGPRQGEIWTYVDHGRGVARGAHGAHGMGVARWARRRGGAGDGKVCRAVRASAREQVRMGGAGGAPPTERGSRRDRVRKGDGHDGGRPGGVPSVRFVLVGGMGRS